MFGRKELLPGLTVAFVAILVAIAVVFSNSQSAERVADEGAVGVRAEAALSVAAAVRNRAAHAQLVAAANEADVADEATLGESVGAAEAAISVFDDRIDDLSAINGSSRTDAVNQTASEFTAAAVATLVLIEAGDVEGSAALIEGRLNKAYLDATALLAAERDDRIEEMELARGAAGRVADAAGFLVAFIVPLGALLLFRSMSRRHQKRVELEQELEREKAVSKTKDESIANLSHELRTPLTSIYGFALALLEMSPSERTEAGDLLSVIASESEELGRMVDDLLTAAAADHEGVAITMEVFDPAVEALEVLAPLEAMGHQIHVEIDAGKTWADRLRLRQVLRNLIANARHHGGPDITVTGTTRQQGGYSFEVIDNGQGVPPDVSDHLFERFLHQGSQPLLTGSVGLGLAIAKLLVTKMEGDISYERRDGLTVFRVELAVVPGANAMDTATDPAFAATAG